VAEKPMMHVARGKQALSILANIASYLARGRTYWVALAMGGHGISRVGNNVKTFPDVIKDVSVVPVYLY
jgi:hypothetical protein